MTDAERDELARFDAFVEVLGVGELEDQEFDRYLALLKLKRDEIPSAP